MEEQDDAELASRCVRGSPEAFEVLVARYQRVLFNVALRMVNSYDDAQDIAQATFVKAFEKLDTYDPNRKFFSWIYRIMINESLNLLRGRRQQEPLDLESASSGNPQEELSAKETSEKVQAALTRLQPNDREVLVLRHFAELSYEEMSAALSIPEKTVKSRLYTARRRLAEILGGSAPR